MHSSRIWISVLFFSSCIGITFIISRIEGFYHRKSTAVVVCVSNVLALLLSRHGFRPSSHLVGMVRVFSVLCVVILEFHSRHHGNLCSSLL